MTRQNCCVMNLASAIMRVTTLHPLLLHSSAATTAFKLPHTLHCWIASAEE